MNWKHLDQFVCYAWKAMFEAQVPRDIRRKILRLLRREAFKTETYMLVQERIESAWQFKNRYNSTVSSIKNSVSKAVPRSDAKARLTRIRVYLHPRYFPPERAWDWIFY